MGNLVHNKRFVLVTLAVMSVLLYLIDYVLVGNVRDIASSLLGNLAFLPIYVIFVTLIVEEILRERERTTLLRKLNMVIGVFFSEVGNSLFRQLSCCIVSSADIRRHLVVTGEWGSREFGAAQEYLGTTDVRVMATPDQLVGLKELLVARRPFLAGLLENQNLLEHEQVTDLLWAVFHLMEELEVRPSFEAMPASDAEHINGDIKRVFGHLSREWILYMQHLRQDYPYLFSLAIRLNPMLDSPDPRVC